MTENEEEKPPRLKNAWLIRDCSVYNEEYKECTCLKGRFNQLFIFGKTLDCGQWKRDTVNCNKFVDEGDIEAGKELIESEKERRKQRLLPHYQNTVWTKRDSPPQNWNDPLPEHILKEQENTYLYVKSKEMKGEIPPSFDFGFKQMCTIM